jgi:hypothetical protein
MGKKRLEGIFDEIHSDKVPSSRSNEIERIVQRLITSKGVELVFRFESAGYFLSIPLADRT